MTRNGGLELRSPLPRIPGVASLGVRVTYPTNAPDGHTTALLRLPNDYVVAVVHSPARKWAVVERHYIVPLIHKERDPLVSGIATTAENPIVTAHVNVWVDGTGPDEGRHIEQIIEAALTAEGYHHGVAEASIEAQTAALQI